MAAIAVLKRLTFCKAQIECQPSGKHLYRIAGNTGSIGDNRADPQHRRRIKKGYQSASSWSCAFGKEERRTGIGIFVRAVRG
jgi:hypothetical protein